MLRIDIDVRFADSGRPGHPRHEPENPLKEAMAPPKHL
jgi:hypothetical protein